jgi:hypothetical protein
MSNWRDAYKPTDYKDNVGLNALQKNTLNSLQKIMPDVKLDGIFGD